MSLPRVLIIYNEPVLPKDHPDAAQEHDVIEATGWIALMLEEAGYPLRQLGFSYDPRALLDELRDHPPDVVFNMFEGLATQTATEVSVVGILEWLRIPFTGSPSHALSLGRDKVRTKFLLQGAGVPTPAFAVIDSGDAIPRWVHGWPAIVKPALQDCSVGIEQGSVVTNHGDLEKRIAHIVERYGYPVLVEQFIFGREFHANVVEIDGEMICIPLAELRFERKPEQNLWPIFSYDAKWNMETEEFLTSPYDTVVKLNPDTQAAVDDVVKRAYRLVGLRDVGRIDLRLSPEEQPMILEVNPNPYLHGEALIDGLKALDREHESLFVSMVQAAWKRAK